MILNPAAWAAAHYGSVQLGDRRLARRAVQIASQMAKCPEASLPAQMGSATALRGAYRLLNHPGVTLEALTAPHRRLTLEQARAPSTAVVLLVEDTTELDYSAHEHTTGLGPIGLHHGQGLLLHSTLAVVPDPRHVLGLAYAQVIRRVARHGSKKGTQRGWWRSSEGRLWEASAQAVGRPPSGAGITWVHVSDRGSDVFEYMATCRELDKHFLLRASRNRRLYWPPEDPRATQAEAQYLLDYARSLPARPEYRATLQVSARRTRPHHPGGTPHPTRPAHPPRLAREAQVVLAWTATPVPLAASHYAPKAVRAHAPFNAWILRVWEPDPPADEDAIEWILITSLPIHSLEDALRDMQWYTCRWVIEDYHQCLKTGCRVERSQLDDGDDLIRLLGFAIPIAVRLLQLRDLARQAPQRLARQVIEPLMVQVLARVQGLNARTLTLEAFWQAVARMGGHQGRRGDGSPGWRTVWRGWRHLEELTEGARLFAPRDPT